MAWRAARTRLLRESTARPKTVTFSGREGSEIRVSTTPASEIAEMVRWRRDPTRKCCAVGSQARPSG
ncbi:S9 family peptidase [Sesbania bispinosa]|nr:S9 family peptidase [Sesbania bispinosa]